MSGYDAGTGFAVVEQRNHMRRGQEIEIFPPVGEGFFQRLEDMLDAEGIPIETAPHAQQTVRISVARPVAPGTILRSAQH